MKYHPSPHDVSVNKKTSANTAASMGTPTAPNKPTETLLPLGA